MRIVEVLEGKVICIERRSTVRKHCGRISRTKFGSARAIVEM